MTESNFNISEAIKEFQLNGIVKNVPVANIDEVVERCVAIVGNSDEPVHARRKSTPEDNEGAYELTTNDYWNANCQR